MTPNSLKTKRKQLGVSQFALAKFAKVSRFNIQVFESGFKILSLEEISRIRKALKKKEASQNDETGNKKSKSE